MIANILISIFAALLSAACWVLSLIGLPGNWGIVILGILLAWLPPTDWTCRMSWWSAGALFGIAALGEVFEFLAGAAGVGKTGGSRQAMILSLAGSIAGAVLGLFVGLPIPIFGSLLASLLFSGIGAALGAILGQRWSQKDWNNSAAVGWGAFWGRVLGTVAKSFCGTAMVTIVLVSVIF